MAKITKKQEQQFLNLTALYHELIRAKHFNKRDDFDNIISQIREEVKEDDEK